MSDQEQTSRDQLYCNIHHKCAAAKSSYGPQNAASERERECMNGSCYFFWIKMQQEIRDLALHERGLSFCESLLIQSGLK